MHSLRELMGHDEGNSGERRKKLRGGFKTSVAVMLRQRSSGFTFRRRVGPAFVGGNREMLQRYADHCREQEYSKVTLKHYRTIGEKFLSYLESQEVEHIHDITATHITGYINTLLGYAYKTVELNLCAIRSFLGYLYIKEFHPLNLTRSIPAIKTRKQNRIPSVWTADHVTKLLDVIDRGNPAGKRDYAMILLVAHLGLRRMDIKHLTLDNLKWQKNRIELIQSKTSKPLSLPLLAYSAANRPAIPI